MSHIPCSCDTTHIDSNPFYICLHSLTDDNLSQITKFVSLPILSNSKKSNFEPAVSSYCLESKQSLSGRWFCKICDIYVDNDCTCHFTEFSCKHAHLFYEQCQTVGVFKNAKKYNVLFDDVNPYCSHREFISVFKKYQIEESPIAHGSFSDAFGGVHISSNQNVVIKVFNQHSSANAIFEEYLLLKSFRYILLTLSASLCFAFFVLDVYLKSYCAMVLDLQPI